MDNTIRERGLRLSVIDGAFSAVMGGLCGGIFLVGFVLKVLDADTGKIGVIASLPMFANLIQLLGSYIIEKTGKSKRLCLISVAVSRALWLLIILLPFRIFAGLSDYRIWVVVGVIGLSSLFAALAGVGWTSWMSELVPEETRGAYFGKRNMISAFFGMLFVLAGGRFINFWEMRYPHNQPAGFIIIFGAGILAGLLSLIFLRAVPETPAPPRPKDGGFNLREFLSPVKDSNFIKLALFGASWIFAVNLAAPFYGVYMINALKIDFSTLTVFGTAATVATLIMMKIWGPITDKLGNKPVLIVSSLALAAVPFLWVSTIPGRYYIPVMGAHILSGAFMAGAGLSQFNILIKLSPREGRSVYLALYAAATGLTGALAPVAGGRLSFLMEDISVILPGYTLTGLHLLFILSAVLIAVSLIFAARIHEEGSSSPMAVVLQLKNDLNLQAGISGASDFIIIRAARGENILRKIDRKTDEIAARSEDSVRRALEKGEKLVEKPVRKIKDFLKEDD